MVVSSSYSAQYACSSSSEGKIVTGWGVGGDDSEDWFNDSVSVFAVLVVSPSSFPETTEFGKGSMACEFGTPPQTIPTNVLQQYIKRKQVVSSQLSPGVSIDKGLSDKKKVAEPWRCGEKGSGRYLG